MFMLAFLFFFYNIVFVVVKEIMSSLLESLINTGKKLHAVAEDSDRG